MRTFLRFGRFYIGFALISVLIAIIVIASCGSCAEAFSVPWLTGKVKEPGKFIAAYEQPTTDETAQVAELWKSRRLLENFVESMNEFVRIPHNVQVVGKECEEANASYDSATRMIEICYELAVDEQELFASNGDTEEEAKEEAYNSIVGTLYHELGHALIGELGLKITGREEDVADQMAAYFFAKNEDMKDILITVADSYAIAAARIDDASELRFYDVHSLDAQRSTNFLCYIYGSNPDIFKSIIKEEYLPESRAEGCREEYLQLVGAWDSLLEPHLIQAPKSKEPNLSIGFTSLFDNIAQGIGAGSAVPNNAATQPARAR